MTSQSASRAVQELRKSISRLGVCMLPCGSQANPIVFLVALALAALLMYLRNKRRSGLSVHPGSNKIRLSGNLLKLDFLTNFEWLSYIARWNQIFMRSLLIP